MKTSPMYAVVRVNDGPIGLGIERELMQTGSLSDAEREVQEWDEWAHQSCLQGYHLYSTYHHEVRMVAAGN